MAAQHARGAYFPAVIAAVLSKNEIGSKNFYFL